MAEDIGNLEAELLADSRPPTRGCSTCQWLDEQPNPEQWDAAFRNPRITSRAIWRKMASLGFSLSDDPVVTHRSKKHRGG